jgi:hypothetical protein
MSEHLTTPEINEAWDRIARTADGSIIYRHLMRLVMAPAPDDSALPRHEGARNLAANLMRLMAEGIADSDRYCVAFVTRTGSAEPRPRGAGRRVTLDTFVPGYDTDDGAGGPGPGPGRGNGAGKT